MARLAKEEDPQAQRMAREVLPVAWSAGGVAWRHPTALYVGPMDFGGRAPMPRVAILCQAGKDAQALSDAIGKLVAMIPPTAPVALKTKTLAGDVVVVGNFDFPEKVEEPLSGRAQFVDAIKGAGVASPAVAAWFDSEKVINLVTLGLTLGGDARSAAMWRGTMQATGIGAVKRICVTGGFDGKDWASGACVEAPKAARVGLLASLLELGPVPDDLLKLAPAGTTWLTATKLDLAKLLADVRVAIKALDPRAAEQFEQALTQINAVIGMDVQADVLGALGDGWVAFSGPDAARGLAGLVVANPLRDAEKAQRSLLSLQKLANDEMAKERRPRDPTFEINSEKVGELTIHSLAIPLAAPRSADRVKTHN
jgi:hypothetical protein